MAAKAVAHSSRAKNGHGPRRRVTFKISEALDNLLEVYCNSTRTLKNDVAEEAIAQLLSQRQGELRQAFRKNQAALYQLQLPRQSRRASSSGS